MVIRRYRPLTGLREPILLLSFLIFFSPIERNKNRSKLSLIDFHVFRFFLKELTEN